MHVVSKLLKELACHGVKTHKFILFYDRVNLLPLLLWTDDSGEVEKMEAGFMSSGWAPQD